MIAKVLWLQKHVWYQSSLNPVPEEAKQLDAKLLADNLAFCGGPCCGNQRERFGPPHDEISDHQPQIWQEPCHECLAAWNESCEAWCPYQRTVKL
jgi:hypothetical protein